MVSLLISLMTAVTCLLVGITILDESVLATDALVDADCYKGPVKLTIIKMQLQVNVSHGKSS